MGKKPLKITYDVCVPSEYGAGILGFTEVVSVEIESGDPGGDDGEFSDYMLQCLKEWFDGGRVEVRDAIKEVLG